MITAANGGIQSVTERDVPSRLFAFYGVFGMGRPTVEVIWQVTCAGLFGICALAICDVLYARHTQARWFALHVRAPRLEPATAGPAPARPRPRARRAPRR